LIAQATYVGVGLKLLQLVSSLLCLTQDTDFIRGEQTIIMAAYMGSRLCDRYMKEYLQTLVCAIRETNACTYAASILYESSDDSGYIDCLIGILEFLLQETQPNCNSFTELCNSTMRLIPNADLNDCVAPDGDYVDELS
uniref:Saposin B-type domain-containing protein n=1 Tax=Hymenolepis diminuta TaxID=6216 RepID=A0A0R3SXR9_HYMDI